MIKGIEMYGEECIDLQRGDEIYAQTEKEIPKGRDGPIP